MSLSDPTYGPHVLVCVRVRGAFQKKKEKKGVKQFRGSMDFDHIIPQLKFHTSVPPPPSPKSGWSLRLLPASSSA